MSSFKAKMHQIRFWLGLRPRPPSWIWGELLLSGGRESDVKGGKGETRYKGEGKG